VNNVPINNFFNIIIFVRDFKYLSLYVFIHALLIFVWQWECHRESEYSEIGLPQNKKEGILIYSIIKIRLKHSIEVID
jgi:hypothetical protein